MDLRKPKNASFQMLDVISFWNLNVNQSLEAVEQGLCSNETRNDLRDKIFMNRK